MTAVNMDLQHVMKNDPPHTDTFHVHAFHGSSMAVSVHVCHRFLT